MKTVGVKLFRGIEGGAIVPRGETVISGLTILIIVPGVVAGIVALFAGINKTGIISPSVRSSVLMTLPTPVTLSVMFKFDKGGTFDPAPMMFTGPKQISPVS